MRWDDLHTFLAVARGGTLAAAAASLGVNATTVHRRVAALEASLGTRLFERDPRGYPHTGVGEALVPRAEEVEEAVLALRRVATGHDRTASGPVRLTLPETLVSVVAPALAAVCDAAPGLRPILHARDDVLDLGIEADVALRPTATPPEESVAFRVGRLAWAVYGPPSQEDDVPWVAYAPEAGPRGAMAWFATHHPDARVQLEVTTVGAMLVRWTGALPEAGVDLWLLVHVDLRRSARVRALLDLLRPHFEGLRGLLEGAGEPTGEGQPRLW